jgi:hypothetical protein
MTREIVSREVFLKKAEVQKEDVPLPEMGNGSVMPVWGMTVRERSGFEKQFSGKNGKPLEARQRELRERLVIQCCRDDSGLPVFQPSDVESLGNLPAAVMERLVNAAMRLSGMGDTDVEALAKN